MFAVLLAIAADEPGGPRVEGPGPSGGVLSYKVGGQYRHRVLHDTPVRGEGGEIDLGWSLGDLAIYGGPDVTAGSTAAGRSMIDFRLHFGAQYALWRIWVGGAATLGYLTLKRATSGTQATTTTGIELMAELDLLRFEPGAIFIGASGGYEVPYNMLTGTLRVGWRGDLVGM